MVITARTILVDVAVHFRTRLAEWVFAAILAQFAYRLHAPGSTFDSSPSYAYLAKWATEDNWSYVIGVVAISRLMALAINGTFGWARPWSPAIRAATAWLSCSVWSCLTVGFYVANPNATGWGTYGVIFVADMCLAIGIAQDAGEALRNRYGRPSRSR